MSDTEIIDWLEKHGASVNRSEQPDMSNNNWHIRCDSIPSSRNEAGKPTKALAAAEALS